MLAITVVGGLIRLWPIVDRPLWFDEVWTWYAATDVSYTDMLRWQLPDVHAPLGFLAARASIDVFGTHSPWALRLPALLCGVLCIPAAYLLGRIAQGQTLGLLAALLVASDPSMVNQSQQARMFSMLALFSLLAMTWAVVLLRHPDKGLWHGIGLGAVLAMALWSNHFAVCVWVGIAGAAAVQWVAGRIKGQPWDQARDLTLNFTVAFGVAAVLSWSGIAQILGRAGHGKEGREAVSLLQISKGIVVAINDTIHLTPVALLLCPLAVIGLILLWKRCRSATVLVGAVAVASLLILIPFRKQVRFIYPRYLTTLQPAFWLGLGMLALSPGPRYLRRAGLVLVLTYSGLQFWQSAHLGQWYQQPDRYLVAPQVEFIREHAQPGDAIVYHPMVLDVFGRYYNLQADPAIKASLYDQAKLRDNPRLPRDVSAPTTWLVIGMVNYRERIETASVLINSVAEHYGVSVDRASLERHLRLDHVTVAKIDAEGAKLRSLGLEGAATDPF